jgi:hypothetical protein
MVGTPFVTLRADKWNKTKWCPVRSLKEAPGLPDRRTGGDLERWAHVLLVVDPFRRLDVVQEMLVYRSGPQGGQRAEEMPCSLRVAAGQRLFQARSQ